MRIIRRCNVSFANEKLEGEFNALDEDNEIKRHIRKAIDEIKENAFCAIPVPKKLIPKEYVQKFNINNLWKYDLPDGWRLIYSITTPNKAEIISIILEWFDHKDYERKVHY
jgi:Txe/YoeB family toxin of Txe-Axe toxin-antitoxin module